MAPPPVSIGRRDTTFHDPTMSPLLHPALGTSLSRSFGLSSPFSLSTLSSSLTALSSSPGRGFGMSLGRSFEDRPQLEAQFFRNFSCCGLDLQDLHGLLEHFEECHVAFEEGDASESGMDVDMEMEDNVSEGTISGPPSPRIPAGQPPRSIYEMKKSSLGSNGLHSSLDPLAPGTSSSNQHLDGGMELDMDMDDTPASIYSSNSQHTISISTTLASNSNSGSASGSTTASNSDTSPSSGAYPPPMSAFHSPLTLAGGSNKKKFSTAMNAHQIGGIMRGSGMGGMMGLEALAAARAASAYSTPDSSVPGTPVMEEVPGGGVNGLFSVGRIEDAGGTASSSQSALGGSIHNMNMGNNGLAPSLFLPASASPSSSTATAEAPDSPPSDSGSNHEGSNSGTESKESTPIFKTLALAPIPNDSRSSYPLLQHSRAATNHAAGSTIVTLSASRSSTAAANAALNAANNAHHHTPSSSRTSHSTATSGGAVEKPFRCAVVGCDKSYKQQNGLKYHRLHGHCTTASLGKIGTESRKAGKPYVCHVSSCGKRYKNMNGLRYHYQHSGAHGALGLSMLAQSVHPPPQYPLGHKRGTESASTSRAASPVIAESRHSQSSSRGGGGQAGGGGVAAAAGYFEERDGSEGSSMEEMSPGSAGIGEFDDLDEGDLSD